MHAVCRKRQGIEWSPAEPQGIDQNMQHLVDVAVRPNPAPAPEDALTLAYGAGSAPKLVSQISGMSLILRKKSLAETLKMVRVPKELAELLHAGLVPALHVAASDDEGEVREATDAAQYRSIALRVCVLSAEGSILFRCFKGPRGGDACALGGGTPSQRSRTHARAGLGRRPLHAGACAQTPFCSRTQQGL
eukprot:2469572-Pleurochrysis_carterae.AAC.2